MGIIYLNVTGFSQQAQVKVMFVFLLSKESSPSVAADQRSLSQPRLTAGSPDHRISRKLSPVEIYYEMRTRRNSVTSSVRYSSYGDCNTFELIKCYWKCPVLLSTARLTRYREVLQTSKAEAFQPRLCWPERLLSVFTSGNLWSRTAVPPWDLFSMWF